MSNINTNNTVSLFSSPQKTEEGYTSLENHRYYMTALAIFVNEQMAKQIDILGLFVQFRTFVGLQEENGGAFPYQRRINTRLPQRSGSSMTRTSYADFERPSEYKQTTIWLSEAINKSLYQMTLNNPQVNAEYDAEFARLMASFVSALFQDAIVELALATQKRHIPAYPTELVASWMVGHVRNINRFAGRGEGPSDSLVDMINEITPEIALTGILLFGNDRALANFNLKTETKYDNALELVVDKLQTDQIIPFNYGFLESGSFMMTSRFPSSLVDNIPVKKFLSNIVISPVVFIPASEFTADNSVLVPGAPGHGFYKVTNPGAKGGEYVVVRLHEVCIHGETLIGTVLASNDYQKPVMAYVNRIQEHNNSSAQGGTQEWVLRQPICVGVAGHESIRTCPAAVAIECEYPDASNPAPWNTLGQGADGIETGILSAVEMIEIKKTRYFNNHVFFKHSFDVNPTLKKKLFGDELSKRFSSLTDTVFENEYCFKSVDDVSCELTYKSGNFSVVQVPYIVKNVNDYKIEAINGGLLQVLAGQPNKPVDEIFTPSFQFTPVKTI